MFTTTSLTQKCIGTNVQKRPYDVLYKWKQVFELSRQITTSISGLEPLILKPEPHIWFSFLGKKYSAAETGPLLLVLHLQQEKPLGLLVFMH